VHQTPPLQVFGEHTGNGDKLAAYILDHYTKWYDARQSKPPLLFLVGEQRRDIIPKTLMSESIPPARRIRVDEVEVYETAVLQSFKDDFSQIMSETAGAAVRWIVVFSPIGLGAMLQNLGLWDPATETAQPATSIGGRTTFVATIGPTTASFLETHFGFKPDVCSAQPSPEALLTSISDFMAAIKRDARPPRVGKK
jgi:uroporphyrinogen-III synthase